MSELTSQQLEVIEALAGGATTIGAADAAGVHRNTITNWRRTSPTFREALAGAHYDAPMLVSEMSQARAPKALECLDEILADPAAPASVRLKAALAIIQQASTVPPVETQLSNRTNPESVHNDA